MSSALKLNVNDLVSVERKLTKDAKSKTTLNGVVKYAGPVSFSDGDDWIGVLLTGDSIGYGRNNGTVHGIRYFRCATNSGLFVRQDVLKIRVSEKTGDDLPPSNGGTPQRLRHNKLELNLSSKISSLLTGNTAARSSRIMSAPPPLSSSPSLVGGSQPKPEELEMMQIHMKKNSDLMSSLQEKEAVIFELKDQIRGDRFSFEENKQRMADENEDVMNEKEECIRNNLDLKINLENLQLKLARTREESGSKAESRKLNELTLCLEQSQHENSQLKETMALMRKEIPIRPSQSSDLHSVSGSSKSLGKKSSNVDDSDACLNHDKTEESEDQTPHPKGVSVFCLRDTLLKEVENNDLSPNSNIYEIDHNIIRKKGVDEICLRDSKKGAAYVDCLEGKDNVGPANIILSYAWGYRIGDIIQTLEDYCTRNKLDTKRTYIWICCLCNNQHRVGENVPFETLHENFRRTVLGVGHVLAMIAPWDKPLNLTRVWCLFEVFTASESEKCKVEIIMPPREKEALLAALHNYGPIVKVLCSANIEKAKTSRVVDKTNIMELVSTSMGTAALNSSVNNLLRNCIQEMILAAVEECRILSNDVYNDVEYASLCFMVGRVMIEDGRFEDAMVLYNTCLKVRESVYGEFHTSIADAYSDIGALMQKMDKLDDALVMFKKCQAIQEQVLGEEHASTAVTYNSVGLLKQNMDKFDDALVIFKKCQAVQEKVLGKDHISTAVTYNNIGRLLQKMDNFNDALVMFKKCQAIQEKVLGEDHISTVETYTSIGLLLQKMDNFDDALVMFDKGMAIEGDVIGEEHASTAVTYNNIGLLKQKMDRFDDALVMFEKCQAIQEKVHGETHTYTAVAYNNIGALMQKMDRFDDALVIFKKCQAIREKVLGEDHTDTAETYDNIGILMKKMNKFDDALVMFEKCQAIREKVLGEDHTDTAETYNNIGLLKQKMDKLDDALVMFEKCQAIEEKVFGANHTSTAVTYNNIGALMQKEGKFDDALVMFEKCLAIQEKVLGKDHTSTAVIYNNIGILKQNMDKFDDALVMLKKCLAIQEKVLGEDHTSTALTNNNIGRLMQKMDK